MNTKGKRNLLKRIMALAVAVVMTLGLVPCMSIKTSAEGGTSAKNDTGKWVTNSDGTLSIDDTAAKNAVSTVEGNVSMVLIGTIGGEITLPAVDATTKVSKKKDAALVLYDPKVSKETVSDMLQQIKFSASTTSVNIAVTDGDTTIEVSSDDATFGIMGNNGEAHIYKYVTNTKTWIGAFHDAVTATDTLGGFKGYLATVTTSEEAELLFEFYTSTNPGNTNGGWIAATSLSYTTDMDATSYSQVKDSRMSPSNYENITSINKQKVGDMYKIAGTDGAYYWSQTSNSGGYGNEFYWACGPEMGEAVPTELWNSGEPNNSGGECSTVASYSGKAKFNDFQPAQTVSGYFLEFSVYQDGLANENVKYKSTTIYRVSYDKNGATGGTVPNVQTKFLNQALTLATNTGNLTRGEGLGFNGWNTQADGNGTHYDAGATYAADNNASLTLYAEWVNDPAKPPTVNGPEDISLKYGYAEDPDNGKLSVVATPDSGAQYDLTYQWYSNTADSNEDGILINGATDATYSIPKGLDIGEHYYYCIVTATKKDDKNKKAATASAAATVTVVKAPAEISYPTSSVKIAFGDDFTNKLTNTGDGAVSYESSNTKVATVDSNGEVTIVGAGGAVITATAVDGTRYYYESGDNTASYTLTVDKADITPVVSMADYTYGTEVVPAPEISGNSGNGAVTYYYNTTDSNTGGTEWTGINGKTLSAGTYYMYAVVEETANYKAATSAPDSFEVTQAANEVTAVNIENWTYGDAANEPSVTADFGADTVQYTYYTDELCTEMTKAADGAASEGGVPSYAGPYWIKAEIPATGNYAGAEGTNSFTINKKAVTITAKPQTINYGGQIKKNDISEAETSSLADDDSLAGISLTASTENATTTGTVTPSEATIKKGETDVTGCYEITYAEGRLTINKVDPTVTPPTANDLTYNGFSQGLISAGSTEHGTLSYAVTTTDSAPQDDAFTYDSDNLPEGLNAGTYYVWYKVTGDDNHNNTSALSVPVTIKKRDISNADVVLTDELTYNGSEQTQGVAGVLIVTDKGPNYQLDAKDSCTFTGNKNTDAGTYTMTVTAGENTNYTGSCTKDYTIGRRAVTLTSGSAEREYDGTPLTNSTVEALGFVEGQGASYNVTGSQTDAGDSENVFIYTFNDGTKDTNYEVEVVKGTLKVTQAQSNAVTVKIKGWEYGQTPNAPEVENVTFGADTVQYTYGASRDGEFTETVPVTVGTWYVKANIPETANYVGASDIAEFEITQKSLKITADDAEKVYDGTELTCDTYTNSELAEGDSYESVTVTGSRTWVGESENISSEAIIVNANGENGTYCYNIGYVSGTLKVTKKAVKITADDAEKVYDGTELTCDTYTNSELAEGDSIVSVAVTGSQTDAGSSDNIPGDAVITDRNGEIATDNYDIQYVNGKLEVTKKAVTVTTDDGSKIFGEKDPEFTFETDGLVGEEALEGITLSREAGEDAGEYIISAESSEEKNINYDITFDNKGKLTIAAKDVTPSVDKIEDKYYTGKEISPELVVKDGEDIIPASEYTVKYKDNVETGKATAVISDVKGGNYNIAETTVNFNILPRGEVEVTEPAEENDCKGKLDEEETAVISKVELSADDQSALDTGKNVSIFLEVKTINDTVSAEDKAVVEETAKNNETDSELTVGWYLDVSLFKQIFGEDKVKITETDGAVGITIEIPESLRKDGRTFYVIRVHDGDGEIIPSKQEGNFIRFTTDRFSTYALAYVDKTDADDASVKPADIKPADDSSSKSEDGLSEVKTGDDTNVLLIFLLMIDSGLAAVYFALQKKSKERRNR